MFVTLRATTPTARRRPNVPGNIHLACNATPQCTLRHEDDDARSKQRDETNNDSVRCRRWAFEAIVSSLPVAFNTCKTQLSSSAVPRHSHRGNHVSRTTATRTPLLRVLVRTVGHSRLECTLGPPDTRTVSRSCCHAARTRATAGRPLCRCTRPPVDRVGTASPQSRRHTHLGRPVRAPWTRERY